MDAIGQMIQDSERDRSKLMLGTLYALAYDIAKTAHTGQERWGGEDYFETHVLAVSDSVELYSERIVALLHDVGEDHPEFWPRIESTFPPLIVDALSCLTHNKETQSYAEYIAVVGTNYLAATVKVADLTHNLSDLKPERAADRQRRDKYELAKLYLTRILNGTRT